MGRVARGMLLVAGTLCMMVTAQPALADHAPRRRPAARPADEGARTALDRDEQRSAAPALRQRGRKRSHRPSGAGRNGRVRLRRRRRGAARRETGLPACVRRRQRGRRLHAAAPTPPIPRSRRGASHITPRTTTSTSRTSRTTPSPTLRRSGRGLQLQGDVLHHGQQPVLLGPAALARERVLHRLQRAHAGHLGGLERRVSVHPCGPVPGAESRTGSTSATASTACSPWPTRAPASGRATTWGTRREPTTGHRCG